MPDAIANPLPTARLLSALGSPLEVAGRWPRSRSLIMLHSGRLHPRWARWSILASPRATYRFAGGRSQWLGVPPTALRQVRFTHDPLEDVDAMVRAAGSSHFRPASTPFAGGWIGYFSYDLGRVIEPTVQGASPESDWPLVELAYCPSALVFDAMHLRWHAVGDVDEALALAEHHEDFIEEAFELGPIVPAISADHYTQMVERAIEYICAGDVFQANIAQRFSAGLDGSPRALALAALQRARPWYGAYLELGDTSGPILPVSALDAQALASPDTGSHSRSLDFEIEMPHRALVSLSPELFLQFDPQSRTIVTRPIKGTRPDSCDPSVLRESAKDAAELHMIVDLMRNDLGRVCEFGSIEVVEPRAIESHPTVHHGVAEVVGRLREGIRIGDILRATFPGGSVTGAPKVRAMQIIDELETAAMGPRGPYCGAIGFISNSGAITMNVAIRTLMMEPQGQPRRRQFPCDHRRWSRVVHYRAGAGIVADSIPRAEHAETLDKAQVLRDLASAELPAR